MSIKWRIYCVDEGGWQYEWSDSTPAECPNNAAHTIRSVNGVSKEVPVLRVIPHTSNINNANYTRVASLAYNPELSGTLRRVKVLTYMDSGITSYDIELYNATSKATVKTANFTNTSEFQVNDLGTIDFSTSGENNLEILIKRNGGKSSNKVYISQITFIAEKEY